MQVKYKKGKLNIQADALSRLKTLGGTVTPAEDDIPYFLAEGEDETPDDLHDDIVQPADELLIATQREYLTELYPISIEELLLSQMYDKTCESTRSRPNEGEDLPFFEDSS